MTDESHASRQDDFVRLQLFGAIVTDIASTIVNNNIREPMLRSPSDLLDYVEEELVNREPVASKGQRRICPCRSETFATPTPDSLSR
jgi:hypothetical protein